MVAASTLAHVLSYTALPPRPGDQSSEQHSRCHSTSSASGLPSSSHSQFPGQPNPAAHPGEARLVCLNLPACLSNLLEKEALCHKGWQ